jgi:Carboxypeptidase regulatory-like domain
MRIIAMNAPILKRVTVGAIVLGLLAPSSLVSAAEPRAAAPSAETVQAAKIADVALATGGTLRGQVVDAAGAPAPGVEVTVRQQDHVVARATSDPSGQFKIAGIQGGIFQMSTDLSDGSYRLWAPETSPPSARPAALIVHDTEVVRGQSRMRRLMSHPVVIVGLVLTAVAVPIAIHAIETNRPSGS